MFLILQILLLKVSYYFISFEMYKTVNYKMDTCKK